MRTAGEMMEIIMGFAEKEDNIRVVTMEGSRLDKNAPVDRFQDFDIAYLVRDMEKYKKSDDWLAVFGERIIMQKPEGMAFFPPTRGGWFSYLMFFEDGNKTDLTLVPFNELPLYFNKADSLLKVLLDKDGVCPATGEPSDRDFRVKKPSAEFVDDCSNEFWWLALYTAKGLCRNEPLFAVKHLTMMKEQMFNMISWKAGVETSFSKSVGKACKYLDKFVPEATWQSIMKTYRNDSIEALWESLIICCGLFKEATAFVSGMLEYTCPDYDKKVMEYIKRLAP